MTVQQIVDQVMQPSPRPAHLQVLAPWCGDARENIKELEELRRQGYTRARIDGEIHELTEKIDLDKMKNHTIEAVIDRRSSSQDREAPGRFHRDRDEPRRRHRNHRHDGRRRPRLQREIRLHCLRHQLCRAHSAAVFLPTVHMEPALNAMGWALSSIST